MLLDIPAIFGSASVSLADESTFTYAGSSSDISVDISGMNIQEDNLVLCIFAYAGSSNSAYSISGFTEVCNLVANDTYDTRLKIGYKVMSTVDSSITLTNGTGDTSSAAAVIVQVWRECLSVLSSNTATGINTSIPNPPALTAAVGLPVIFVGANAGNDGGGSFTSTDADMTSVFSALESNRVCLGAGYVWGDGSSFDPAALSFSGGDNSERSWCSCTLSLEI